MEQNGATADGNANAHIHPIYIKYQSFHKKQKAYKSEKKSPILSWKYKQIQKSSDSEEQSLATIGAEFLLLLLLCCYWGWQASWLADW